MPIRSVAMCIDTVAIVYAIRLVHSEVELQKNGGATIPVTEFETTIVLAYVV